MYLGQILMHELDDDGAFADAGSDALHRTVADIPNNKNAGDVGFEQAGIAVERPRGWALAIAKQIRAGEDEAAFVAFDEIAEPFACVAARR